MMGTLQRRIWRAFLVRPPGTILSTSQLMPLVYPRIRGRFQHWHWYGVRRAAAAVAVPVRRSSRGRGRPLLWKAKTVDAHTENPLKGTGTKPA